MAIVGRGNIGERPFARSIYWIAAKRFTGDFAIDADGETYRLWWHNGTVIDAHSPSPADTEGRVALTIGLVNSTQLGEALRRSASDGASSTLQTLVEIARLSPQQLLDIKRRAFAQRALRMFAIEKGRFLLDDTGSTTPDPDLLALPVRWLIYRGLRLYYSEERLSREFAVAMGARFSLPPSGVPHVREFGFGNREQKCIEALTQQAHTLDELIERCTSLSRKQVLALVYSLLATDVIVAERNVAQGAAVSSRPVPYHARPGTSPSAPPGFSRTQPLPPVARRAQTDAVNAPPPPQPRPAPARPASKLPASKLPASKLPASKLPASGRPAPTPPSPSPSRPSTQVLPNTATQEPPPQMTAQAVSQRSSRSTMRIHGKPGSRHAAVARPVKQSGSRPIRATVPIHQIAKAKGHSVHHVQGPKSSGRSTTMPAASPEVIRGLIKHKLTDIDDGCDYFTLLGVPQDASPGAIRQAYFGLARKFHPDRLRAAGITDMTTESQRLFAEINLAFGVLSVPQKCAEYKKGLSKPRQSEEDALKANRIISAEEHFRRGEWALRSNQWEEARNAFTKAAELNPDEAEHHALLAWTLWCLASDREAILPKIKEMFVRAFALSPKNLAALYFRARVASMCGDIENALSYFQQVQKADADYRDVALQIRVIEGRKKRQERSGILDRLRAGRGGSKESSTP